MNNGDEKQRLLKEMEDLVGKIGPEHAKHPAAIMTKFARLWVLLAGDAEKTSRKIVWLTWALVGFSLVLVFIGCVQIAVMLK